MAKKSIPEAVKSIQECLQEGAQGKTKSWWENYVKGSSFRGCNMATTRQAMEQGVRKHGVREWPPEGRVQLGMALLGAAPFTDDKLAGVLLLAEVCLPAGDLDGMASWQSACEQWKSLFLSGKIADWNICDWFCVKVLGPGAARNGGEGAKVVLAWSHLPVESSTVWLRRAGHVAFVYHIASGKKAAGDELFYQGFVVDCIEAAEAAARTGQEANNSTSSQSSFESENARFAHTGAGWVLRHCLLAQRQPTIDALQRLKPILSKEGMKSALEKCKDTSVKGRLLRESRVGEGHDAAASSNGKDAKGKAKQQRSASSLSNTLDTGTATAKPKRNAQAGGGGGEEDESLSGGKEQTRKRKRTKRS